MRKLIGQRSKCPACGLYFNSTAAFDKHRTGEYGFDTRRCRTETEMRAIGMDVNAKGWWITSKRTDSSFWRRGFSGDQSKAVSTQGVPQ